MLLDKEMYMYNIKLLLFIYLLFVDIVAHRSADGGEAQIPRHDLHHFGRQTAGGEIQDDVRWRSSCNRLVVSRAN